MLFSPVTSVVRLSCYASVMTEMYLKCTLLWWDQLKYRFTCNTGKCSHGRASDFYIWTVLAYPYVPLVGPRMCPPDLITLLDHFPTSSHWRISEWKSLQELMAVVNSWLVTHLGWCQHLFDFYVCIFVQMSFVGGPGTFCELTGCWLVFLDAVAV